MCSGRILTANDGKECLRSVQLLHRISYPIVSFAPQLLVEYLLSRQLDEAAACVKELDCSLFHNEIVKRAVKVRRRAFGVLLGGSRRSVPR